MGGDRIRPQKFACPASRWWARVGAKGPIALPQPPWLGNNLQQPFEMRLLQIMSNLSR
jgi:hypothetical protein